MRYYFLPLVLTVLAATAPSHANENNGVMIFKANKPYASPFDKPQGVSESPVLPSTLGSPPSGVDWSNPTPVNVQEKKKKKERKDLIFLHQLITTGKKRNLN